MTTLFISDLHLDAAHPAAVDRFVRFAADEARAASSLFILGDLFEAWVGDDDDDERLEPIVDALAGLTRAGVACGLMHGNRDFLIGPRFCARTGCRLLGDFERIELDGEPLLLTHGDLLCTDDTRYLTLRETLRDPKWQSGFLAKPLAERRTIASHLRQLSMSEIADKPLAIMDVNQTAVEGTMREHDTHRLLHGHTHRPGVHRFELDGQPAERIVLGAWHEQASIARHDADGLRLETLS